MRPSSASAALALVSLLALGCNTAKLTPAPDASPDCNPKAEYPCAPIADGGSGCGPIASPQSDVERNLTIDASYPSGCTVFVNDPVPDEQLNCIQLGSCRCDADDAGALGWKCTPPGN